MKEKKQGRFKHEEQITYLYLYIRIIYMKTIQEKGIGLVLASYLISPSLK